MNPLHRRLETICAPPSDASPRSVTILGATGSIGRSTVDLLQQHPEQFSTEALVAGRNVPELARLARLLRSRCAVVADPACYRPLASALSGSGIEVAAGHEAVVEAAARPSDWLISGIVGAAALAPTLAAIRRGAIIALANKECLVCAGGLLMREVEQHRAVLVPVDSEHSAIFQALDHDGRTDTAGNVARLVLTASGGPFRSWPQAAMANITPAQAADHPNWSMGVKISIDSATMMNKGLELVEAHHLFAMPEERIDIVVHPQSIIHSLVAYRDGSVLAQLGTPDMRTPIAYALGWPRRLPFEHQPLDLLEVARLDFEPPDVIRFPALRLAREALRAGGSAPTILNAANEVAVAAFVEGRIGFLEIARIVEDVLAALSGGRIESLCDVTGWDEAARCAAHQRLGEPAPVTARAVGL